MAGKPKTLEFEWKGSKFKKVVKPPKWGFEAVKETIKKNTNLSFPTQCVIEIDGNDIDNEQDMISAMNKQIKRKIGVQIKVQQLNTQGGISLLFLVGDTKFEMVWDELEEDDDFDFDLFYDKFTNKLKEDLSINSLHLFSKVKLYVLNNESTKSKYIPDKDNFEAIMYDIIEDESHDVNELSDLEDVNDKYDDDEKEHDQKLIVKVDLREADCKEELQIKISGECVVGDDATDEQWFEAYSDVLNEIGDTLKNNDWTKLFELYTKDNNGLVSDLNEFIRVMKRQYSTGNKTIFSFCVKPRTTAVENKHKLFIIECNGNSVSWQPDFGTEESRTFPLFWIKQYFRLQSVIEQHFPEIKINSNSIIICCDNSEIAIKQLRLDTVESYWKELTANGTKSTMKFAVKKTRDIVKNDNDGDSSDKLVRLVTGVRKENNTRETVLYFGEGEDDMDENYQMLIKYINTSFGISIGDNENDNDYEYSTLGYTIHKIEREDYKSMNNKKENEIEWDEMVEIEDSGDFENCYESDDSTNGRECALVIEPKCCILFKMESSSFIWIPQNIVESTTAKFDWEHEYSRAMDQLRLNFGIKFENDDIVLTIDHEKQKKLIANEKDLGALWNSLVANDSTQSVVINVNVSQRTDNPTSTNDQKCDDEESLLEQELAPFVGHNAQREMSHLFEKLKHKQLSTTQSTDNKKFTASLTKLFDHLLCSLEMEGYSTSGLVYNYTKASKQAMPEWDQCCKSLKQALDIIQPFNIPQMLYLFDKTEEAAKQVENEDIVIVLGHTGAGKSTTIHFLAGSEMTQDPTTRHIYPSKVINAALKNVRTEYAVAQSVTRYITGVPITMKEAGIRVFKDKAKNRMVLCDTPGFDDTSGAEVDVANGLGIVRAVSLAKEAKILLVIGRADLDGSRMRGAKQLCYTLANIMPGFKQFLSSIGIVITKMANDGGDANATLENIFVKALEEMAVAGENNDEAVVDLFTHILEKLEEESVVVLNPIKDKRKTVLSKLFKKETGWIQYPQEEFKSFVTESSMDKIKQQILIHKESIMKSSMNYELIDDKLTQLKQLHQVLPLKEIIDNMIECIDIVCKSWNAKCKDCIDTLITSINERSLNEFENDVKHYKMTLNHFQKYDYVRKKHLVNQRHVLDQYDVGENKESKFDNDEQLQQLEHVNTVIELSNVAISPNLLQTTLTKQFEKLLSQCAITTQMAVSDNMRVSPSQPHSQSQSQWQMGANEFETKDDHKKEVKEETGSGTSQEEEVNTECDIEPFEKARIIATHFESDFQEQYDTMIAALSKKVIETGKMATKAIDNRDFGEFCNFLSQLHRAYEVHQDIGDPCKIYGTIDMIEGYLISCLTSITSKLSEIFPLSANFSSSKSNGRTEQAQKIFQELEEAHYQVTQAKYLNIESETIEQTVKMYETTVNTMVEYCTLLCKHIADELWHTNTNELSSKDSGTCSVISASRFNAGNINNKKAFGNANSINTNVDVKHKMRQMKSYIEYLKEIRGISEEIELKTVESYHQTLRQIENYLNNTERQFEWIVRNLDRSINIHESNIDYNELVDCIAILKDSDWVFDIDNDMMGNKTNDESQSVKQSRNVILENVIAKLVGHFDILANISDNNYITLENLHSLDKVDTVMKQLNKMRPVERLIPKVTEMSDKIASRINQDVIGILESIRSVYSNDNSKNKAKEEKQERKENKEKKESKESLSLIDTINKKKTINRLSFVKKCGTISWFVVSDNMSSSDKTNSTQNMSVKKEINVTLTCIETYLNNWCMKQQKRMSKCLNFLNAVESNLNETSKATECGNILSEILTEFTQIDNKYDELMKYFDEDDVEILKIWTKKLNESYQELEKKLLKFRNANDVRLQTAATRAYSFSKVDWFLKGSKFSDLYIGYEKQFRSDAGYIAVVDCIQKRNFMEIEEQMNRMEQMINVSDKNNKEVLTVLYEQAQTLLTRMMDDLYDEANVHVVQFSSEYEVSKPNVEYVKRLRLLLKQVKDAECCERHYVNSDKNRNSLEQKKTRITRQLDLCMNSFKNGIITSIQQKQFKHAEQQIESLGVVSKLVNRPMKTNEIKTQLEETLDAQVAWYKQVDLKIVTRSPYHSNPPKDLYDALKDVMSSRTKYETTWTAIDNDIIEKFRERLTAAREATTRQKRNEIVRLCNSITKSLATKTRTMLEEDLATLNQEIKANDELEQGILNDLEKNVEWDYNETSDTYFSKMEEKRLELVIKMKRLIMQKMKNYANETKIHLKEYDAPGVFESFSQMNLMYVAFTRSQFQNITKPPEMGRQLSLKTLLSDLFNATRTKIEQKCDETVCCSIPLRKDANKTKFEKQMTFVSIMIQQERENRDAMGITMSIALSEFGKTLTSKFDEFFTKHTKQFGKAVSNLDCKSFCQVLNVMKLYSRDNATYLQNIDFFDRKPVMDGKAVLSMDYDGMIDKVRQTINDIKGGILNDDLINKKTNLQSNKASRLKYYQKLKEKLDFLRRCSHYDACRTHLNLNSSENSHFDGDCIDKVKCDILSMCDDITKIVEQSHNLFEVKTLEKIQLYLVNLDAFGAGKVFRSQHDVPAAEIDSEISNAQHVLEDKFNEMCDKIKKNIKSQNAAQEACDVLIDFCKASQILTSYKHVLNQYCDEIIKLYVKDVVNIAKFALMLDSADSVYGGMLVASSAVFKGENTLRFNQATNARGIDFVLDHLEFGSIRNRLSMESKDRLKKRFQTFEEIYWVLVHQNIKKTKLDVKKIVSNVKSKASKVVKQMKQAKQKRNKNNNENESAFGWTADIKGILVDMMAHIFALWTLQNSSHYFEVNKSSKGNKAYLLQPRAAQVISIFRILNIDAGETEMKANLVEIGTGEGKSITLAVTACILGLIGFEVSCVCYSEHLSSRDHHRFSNLFQKLGVENRIKYGTIVKLCESLINTPIDLRKRAQHLILSNEPKGVEPAAVGGGAQFPEFALFKHFRRDGDRKHKKARLQGGVARVLLFDEVDMLFTSDFYGQTYNPIVTIQHETIKQLTDHIWNHGEQKISHKAVKKSAAYQQVKNRYSRWVPLFDKHVTRMVEDLKSWDKGPMYIVEEDRIGYQILDTISFSTSFGYKTMFAYYGENEKGNISNVTLDGKKGVEVKCGHFSFVELCKSFDLLIGVTGTLGCLSQLQRSVIRHMFKIEKFTYMPSLFGKENKLTFKKLFDIKVYNEVDYFENLKEEIVQRLNDHELPRCVFVFFESSDKLREFYDSVEFGLLRDTALVMTEENSKDEKESLTKRACMSNSVLLTTKSFGRGTDFYVIDKQVLNNGGPHVIQAFLSEDQTEEQQIQGRTARQGTVGSYSMVLSANDLKIKYDISGHDLKNAKEHQNLYPLLNQKRAQFFKKKHDTMVAGAKVSEKKHQVSAQWVHAVQQQDTAGACKILLEINSV